MKHTNILRVGFYALLFVFMWSSHAEAQRTNPDYTAAIGIRAGLSTGLTAKLLLGEHTGFELIAGAELSNGTFVALLYEYHGEIISNSGLRWFLGGGANYKAKSSKKSSKKEYWGVNAIAGIDWKVKRVPLNFSLDLKPIVHLGGGFSGDIYFDGGVSMRYTF